MLVSPKNVTLPELSTQLGYEGWFFRLKDLFTQYEERVG